MARQLADRRARQFGGELEGGLFVARPDSLVTLCPSKFTDKQAGTDT